MLGLIYGILKQFFLLFLKLLSFFKNFFFSATFTNCSTLITSNQNYFLSTFFKNPKISFIGLFSEIIISIPPKTYNLLFIVLILTSLNYMLSKYRCCSRTYPCWNWSYHRYFILYRCCINIS